MSSSRPPTPSRDHPGVLVVDDDRAIRVTVQEILADEGYAVRAVENGREALEVLRTTEALPGIILLDLRMPVMDGWSFRQQQKADPRLADIPVLVLSADGAMA